LLVQGRAASKMKMQDREPKYISGWGHPKKTPAEPWAVFEKRAYYIQHRPWLDHLSRVKLEDGRIRFIAEPYWITDDDLLDLAQLREAGWNITIGGISIHDPSTVRIAFDR
jgi:hypothetical protein